MVVEAVRMNEMPKEFVDLGKLTLSQLRKIIKGNDSTLPKGQAMALLLVSQFPNKHRDFQEVLQNEDEPSTIRASAAHNLGVIGTPVAQEILINNINTDDDHVWLNIVRSLGQFGDESALEAINNNRRQTSQYLADQAKFAASLIAYRIGLDGYNHTFSDEIDCMELSSPYCLNALVRPARQAEIESCMISLLDEPFGIEYSESFAYRLEFDEFNWMIVLNREFTGPHGLDRISSRKGILGVIVEWHPVFESYYVLLLMLTTPRPVSRSIEFHLHRRDGNLAYLGQGPSVSNNNTFSLQTISKPGILPLEMNGTFTNGNFKINSLRYAPSLILQHRPPAIVSNANSGNDVPSRA